LAGEHLEEADRGELAGVDGGDHLPDVLRWRAVVGIGPPHGVAAPDQPAAAVDRSDPGPALPALDQPAELGGDRFDAEIVEPAVGELETRRARALEQALRAVTSGSELAARNRSTVSVSPVAPLAATASRSRW
jgi:hypothetical protein